MSLQESNRIQLILNGPIHKMLFKLAAPNMVSVFFMLVVGFAEPFFAGKLGIIQLASVAITYPLVSLSGMIGAGAVGGGVVSALSRSIGKNDLNRANVVIWHSFIIYGVVALTFFIVFVFFSRNLFIAMGVEESVVEKAVGYSRLFFILSPSIFLFYLMMSIYRSFGDYQFLAVINVLLGMLQLFLSGALSLGWFFFPSLGVNGLALAFVIPQGMAGILMFISILFGKYPIRFKILALRKEIFVDILNVGGLGAINSTSIALTMVFTTAFISRFGTEAIAGYGVARKDCVVVSSPARDDLINVSNETTATTNIVATSDTFTKSDRLVMDGNYLKVYDKFNDQYIEIPAASSTAGLMAETDRVAAPWFSPAGIRRGQYLGVTAINYNPNKTNRDTLYKMIEIKYFEV